LQERLAFELLHHKIINFALMAGAVGHTHVGVVQAGDGFQLTLEPFAQFRAVGEMSKTNLDATIR
jgi:hypothetical protein